MKSEKISPSQAQGRKNPHLLRPKSRLAIRRQYHNYRMGPGWPEANGLHLQHQLKLKRRKCSWQPQSGR
jgi:hypothetical protein